MTWGRSITEQRERREARRERNLQVLVHGARGTMRGTYAGATTGTAINKGVKARPGKRAPTVAERAWMDAITAYGCIACRIDGFGCRPAAVHHILRGGRRMGHLFTLPLCDPGHHQGTQESRHPFKARFEAKYGTEMELLDRLRADIAAQKGKGPQA